MKLAQFKQKFPVHDKFGKPVIIAADSSNPWWVLLEEAVSSAGKSLESLKSVLAQQMLISLGSRAYQL